MKTKEAFGIIGNIEYRSPWVRVLYWCMFILMIVLAAVCILPPVWIMVSSLKDIKEFYAIPPTLIPRSFNAGKLWETWQEFNFLSYYLNTAYLAIGSVLFCLTFNGLAGYFFSKLKPRGSALLFALIVWTMMVPNTVGMVPLFKNLIDFPLLHLNLTNTYWPMWFMAAVNPVVILIFKNFFDTIPLALLEAAKIDGASTIGIFIRVILPLSGPVMATITILTMNSVWQDFFWPFMVLKDKSTWSVIVAIYNLKATLPQDIQFIALTFAILPPIILFVFFQKYIMNGQSFGGSIKG